MGTTRVPLEPTNYSWQQIVDRRQRYANGELERNRRNEGANCVLPGFVATPRLLAMPESNRNRMLGAIPSGRYGRPDEVTDLVTFLVRDDAGYITAQEIGIDGGLELNTLSISIVGSKDEPTKPGDMVGWPMAPACR